MTVLTYPGRKPYDWTKADLRDRVYWSLDGRTPVIAGDGVPVTGSLFTIGWLDWADARCVALFGVHIHVIQPAFHEGFALSAGTHDRDRCMDISIPGVGWWRGQKFLRAHFGGFWWRHTGSWRSPSAWHYHGFPVGPVSLGLPVGEFVPGQMWDYAHGAFGLAGQHVPGSDRSWAPKDRNKVWPWTTYIEHQRRDRPLNDADVAKIVKGILDAEVGPDGDRTPVRTALYRASNIPDIVRSKVQRIMDKIGVKDA